jgi:hypothetical protein
MICTEKPRAIAITRCTNATLRGLEIDYGPLPYRQGRIVAISADRQVYELELFDGHPDAATVRNFKYEIFRPKTRTLRCEDRSVSKTEVVDSDHRQHHHELRRRAHPRRSHWRKRPHRSGGRVPGHHDHRQHRDRLCDAGHTDDLDG